SIEIDKFNTYNMEENYIYFTVKRFDKVKDSKGFTASQSRWKEILKVKSEKTAKTFLEKALTKGIIHKNEGDYGAETVEGKSQLKQATNTFRTAPFKDHELSNQSKKAKQKEAEKRFREGLGNELGASLSDYEYYVVENTEIFNTYEDEDGESLFPWVDQYATYFEVKDNIKVRDATEVEETFIQAAERRMKQMKNNPKFHETLEEGRDFYLQQLKEKKEDKPKEYKTIDVKLNGENVPLKPSHKEIGDSL